MEQLDLFNIVTPNTPIIQSAPTAQKTTMALKRTARTVPIIERIQMLPQVNEIDFLHTVMCQGGGMPRSETSVRSWERRSGRSVIILEAGTTAFPNGETIEELLPCGVKPRLALLYIIGEIVRTKGNIISIKDSATAFCKSLGIGTSGREIKQFKLQLRRLAACNMTIGLFNGTESLNVKTNLIDEFKLWASDSDKQHGFWVGELTASIKFVQSVLKNAVPFDRNAIAVLKNSAFKLDLYTWLGYRAPREKKRSGTLISWEQVWEQLGREYSQLFHFKSKLKKSLKIIESVYPGLRIREEEHGILILPSGPPVPRKIITLSK